MMTGEAEAPWASRQPISMPQGELIFRRFELGDANDVWRLHRAASVDGGVRGPEGTWEDDLRNICETYIKPGGDFLLAHIGSQLVAMGGLKPVDADVAQLKRMRVDPAFRRRGFGRRLLRELESRAVAAGFKRIMLDTTKIQLGAQRLYETADYVRRREGTLHGYAVIFYEKRLADEAGALHLAK
ncbi:GNAT family N-acetyltransferase [Bradyrhizobium sp. CB82]|uniref:GNAT family N-acetyltransferase n=1 Tax=Bradyrhizobium sp. CB82 TaxID=3039159 RepID=UPI0024B1FD82|nr:GNAT family N-acetyltransferase [Bradyrhizobium sp. CB82]WFU40111.1 GNAT family N-acetyltransferase [Bradyrhizobium sp. CB82]